MKHARVHTLSFELPKPDSDVVIRAEIHEVIETGGEVTFTSGTTHEIFRQLPDVLTQVVNIVDPITQQSITISLAALTAGVSQAVRAWMSEEIQPGRWSEDQKYIIGD